MATLTILRLLLLSLYTASFAAAVAGSPPAPVISCAGTGGNTDCIVTNGYGTFPDRTTCRVAAAAFPSDELELIQAVSNASKKAQHMKAVTRYSHSLPKLSCPGGPDGEGLAISTERLDAVIDVDLPRRRMTFGAGITLHALLDAAAAHGLALPASPYWLGVSLGGMIGTGSHGSSLAGKGSAAHEYVVGMRIVVPRRSPEGDGYYARVVELREGDGDLLAAKVSLGVLGVLSEVTMQMVPMFRRWVRNMPASDVGLEDSIGPFGAAWRFGDITWFPSAGAALYRQDTDLPAEPDLMTTTETIESEVVEELPIANAAVYRHDTDLLLPESTAGGGFNVYPFLQPMSATAVEAARAAEVAIEAAGDAEGKCNMSRAYVATFISPGDQPIIGNQNYIQAEGSCLFASIDDSLVCGWDPRVSGHGFTFNTAVSIPMSRAAAFFSGVKELRRVSPAGAFCGLDATLGILIRYVRASTAYLGKPEDSVEMDLLYYRSDDPDEPRIFQDVFEEVEQMALFQYGGLPHLGKNRNVAFVGMREKFGEERVGSFVEVMRRYDEEGLFSSDWTDVVLGLEGRSLTSPEVERRRGCALEGMCVCSDDEHCAPERGYYCRSGRVYADARVCRKVSTSTEEDSLA